MIIGVLIVSLLAFALTNVFAKKNMANLFIFDFRTNLRRFTKFDRR